MTNPMADQTISTAELATERAEHIEADANVEHLVEEALDFKFSVTSRGNIDEITVITTTGGPHVEVELYSASVRVAWGGESHRVPIFDDEDNNTLARARHFYEMQAEAVMAE